MDVSQMQVVWDGTGQCGQLASHPRTSPRTVDLGDKLDGLIAKVVSQLGGAARQDRRK